MICPWIYHKQKMSLPIDLWRYILAFVPGWDVIKNVSRVSKSLNKFAKDKDMWKLLCTKLNISIIEEELPKREDRYQWLWLCKNNKQEMRGPHTIINKNKCVGFCTTDKYTYEGDFFDGKANGFGKLTDEVATGVAQFLDGKRHGQNYIKYFSGDIYDGECFNGELTGKGIFRWVGGVSKKYEGNIYKSLNEGFGIYNYRNGLRYEGNWHKNQRYGIGKLYFIDGYLYNGEWNQDLREGYGQLLHHGKIVYKGQWEKDLPKQFENHWNGLFTLSPEQSKELVEKIRSMI